MTMLHRRPTPRSWRAMSMPFFALHGESWTGWSNCHGNTVSLQQGDFVLIPGFPFGGMEHVGAIQYRAESLLLDASPPLTDTLRRAHLIAHETAHMWFGDLK